MTANDLVGCEVVLELRGLLLEESESCTVTQLITLVLWLVPELQEGTREVVKNKHFSKSKKTHLKPNRNGNELTRQQRASGHRRLLSRCGW